MSFATSSIPESQIVMVKTNAESDKPEFDASISAEEREYCLKEFSNVEAICNRRVHCTGCGGHIGTAPANESNMNMHPVLRVTHCSKCHDFYNSGEFIKGEDGSELYCRWCGQGGEVYCCAICPYVFCKLCITRNLSKSAVAEVDTNENWHCFRCAPKVIWNLRAEHWALMQFVAREKQRIKALGLSDNDWRQEMAVDRATCCRTSKTKNQNQSLNIIALSKRTKKSNSRNNSPAPKKLKINDEVVCTPDLSSMLEPECTITMPPKRSLPTQSTRPAATEQHNSSLQLPITLSDSPQLQTNPPPLVLRNTTVQVRPFNSANLRRPVSSSPRIFNNPGSSSPVYHTINGYRIDLNTASQQDTFRLPNGKLIQVKRQFNGQVSSNSIAPQPGNFHIQGVHQPSSQQQQQQQTQQVPLPTMPNSSQAQQFRPLPTVRGQQRGQNPSAQSAQPLVNSTPAQRMPSSHTRPQIYRLPSAINISSTPVNSNNVPPLQIVNGTPNTPVPSSSNLTIRPVLMRQVYPSTAIGQARTQLQDEVFSTMEIVTHLSNKLISFTNSNAYRQARNYMDVKELYIHLSYVLSYAIARFKGKQDQCLEDMRQMGFYEDAKSLENGQLAAAIDLINCSGHEDIDLTKTGLNSFHNQVNDHRRGLLHHKKRGREKDEVIERQHETCEDDDNVVNTVIGNRTSVTNDSNDLQWISDGEDDPELTNIFDKENAQLLDSSQTNQLDTMRNGSSNSSLQDPVFSHVRQTREYTSQEKQSHAIDRKLTILVRQYPAIWCTQHPDYGNYDMTRALWKQIAKHFRPREDIKLRWKNIRKRYVRIERRMRDGKGFSGYVDKATNFLINRNLPRDKWVEVEQHGDEENEHNNEKASSKMSPKPNERKSLQSKNNSMASQSGDCVAFPEGPIDIHPVDMKIINFVKANKSLWQGYELFENDAHNVMAQQTIWKQLWKVLPNYSLEFIIERWKELYDMYKCFRVKLIKEDRALSELEYKYSKYLAKLYFLFGAVDSEAGNKKPSNDEDFDESEYVLLQSMPDDKDFVRELVHVVHQYPALWNKNQVNYHDTSVCDSLWRKVATKLSEYDQKSKKSDEDIQIVEPKTDTIELDSDPEEDNVVASNLSAPASIQNPAHLSKQNRSISITPVPCQTMAQRATSTSQATGPLQIMQQAASMAASQPMLPTLSNCGIGTSQSMVSMANNNSSTNRNTSTISSSHVGIKSLAARSPQLTIRPMGTKQRLPVLKSPVCKSNQSTSLSVLPPKANQSNLSIATECFVDTLASSNTTVVPQPQLMRLLTTSQQADLPPSSSPQAITKESSGVYFVISDVEGGAETNDDATPLLQEMQPQTNCSKKSLFTSERPKKTSTTSDSIEHDGKLSLKKCFVRLKRIDREYPLNTIGELKKQRSRPRDVSQGSCPVPKEDAGHVAAVKVRVKKMNAVPTSKSIDLQSTCDEVTEKGCSFNGSVNLNQTSMNTESNASQSGNSIADSVLKPQTTSKACVLTPLSSVSEAVNGSDINVSRRTPQFLSATNGDLDIKIEVQSSNKTGAEEESKLPKLPENKYKVDAKNDAVTGTTECFEADKSVALGYVNQSTALNDTRTTAATEHQPKQSSQTNPSSSTSPVSIVAPVVDIPTTNSPDECDTILENIAKEVLSLESTGVLDEMKTSIDVQHTVVSEANEISKTNSSDSVSLPNANDKSLDRKLHSSSDTGKLPGTALGTTKMCSMSNADDNNSMEAAKNNEAVAAVAEEQKEISDSSENMMLNISKEHALI